MANKIKKEDKVKVIYGKEKGKTAKVVKLLADENKLLLENINMAKRHTKPSQKHQGGIIEKGVALDASKVMLVCPACDKPTRVGFKVLTDKNKKKVRVCKKCGENIDK